MPTIIKKNGRWYKADDPPDSSLAHYGVKGMKWGEHNYLQRDTPSQNHLLKRLPKNNSKSLSKTGLKSATNKRFKQDEKPKKTSDFKYVSRSKSEGEQYLDRVTVGSKTSYSSTVKSKKKVSIGKPSGKGGRKIKVLSTPTKSKKAQASRSKGRVVINKFSDQYINAQYKR